MVSNEYAELVGNQEQERYTRHYNLRTDWSYKLGNSVLILAQEKARSNIFNRWQARTKCNC